jgi:hypothetical protein
MQHKYNSFFFKSLVITLIGLVTISSCYKERLGFDKISGGSLSPTVAVPVAFGDLTMSDIIERSSEIWIEDPDGLLSLVYVGDTLSDLASDIISFPDQISDTNIFFSMPPNSFPGDTISTPYLTINSNFEGSNNERIDSILLKNGNLKIEITTDLNHSSSIIIVIPQITKYGSSFYQQINIPYTSGGTHTVTRNISLQDYFINLHQNGSADNQVDQYVKIIVYRGNGSDNSPYYFNIKQTISNINYYEVYGYFHQKTFSIDKTKIPISMFDNSHYSQIFVEDPELRMIFANSIGIPMNVTFDDLYVERDGVKLDITSPSLPTVAINYPDFGNIGSYDTTIIAFNKSNSNIKDILDFNPKKLIYKGSVLSNPTSTVVDNYILDTSKVGVRLELEVPLFGRALTFTLQDTNDFVIEDTYDLDGLESIDFNVNSLSYFPFDASLQLYFTDTNNVVLDSLFDGMQVVLKGAIPGPAPEYKVTEPVHSMTTVQLTGSKLDNMKEARKIILSAKMSTYDEGTKLMKIYSDYKLSLEMSAKGKYKLDF